MPPSARQTAFAKTLYSLVELAEESIDDAEQLYLITFRTVAYMAFSLAASPEEVRNLINLGVNQGFEDYQEIIQNSEIEIEGEDDN